MADTAPVQQPRPALPSAAAPLRPPAAPGGILVVDDHDLVRLGFRALVQTQAAAFPQRPEVFEARTLAEALTLYAANESAIGVVLLDLALADTQGLSGLAEFRKHHPAARIVVLSGTANAAQAQGALALGATAFLAKSGDLNEVVRFIEQRGLFEGRAIGGGLSTPAEPDDADGGGAQRLSPRQLQVLDLLLAGKSNREIAQWLELTEGTVKNHVSTILLVCGMRSRAQLISQLR